MVKSKIANKSTSTSALKDAKLEIKNLKAQLKAIKADHKKELQNAVEVTYDRAIHAAFDQFEQREIAREAVIEKAVNQALAQFEKDLDKKAGKKAKVTKKKKAAKTPKTTKNKA